MSESPAEKFARELEAHLNTVLGINDAKVVSMTRDDRTAFYTAFYELPTNSLDTEWSALQAEHDGGPK